MGAVDHRVAVGAPEADAVVVAQRLAGGDADIVDERAVCGSEVLDVGALVGVRDAGVLARHGGVEDLHLVGRAAPDGNRGDQSDIGVLTILVLDDQVGAVLKVAFATVFHGPFSCLYVAAGCSRRLASAATRPPVTGPIQ